MFGSVYISALLLFLVAGIQRSLFRFFFPSETDFDTYAHVYRVGHLKLYRKTPKNQRSKDPLFIKDRFVRNASTNDPFLILKLVSYLPSKLMPTVERYFNAFVDAVFSVILFLFLYSFTGALLLSFCSALIYVFTPIFFTIQSTGPRTKAFTPRMTAEVFGGVSLIFLFNFFVYHHVTFYIVAGFFAALAMMSNGFAGQAIVFLSLILGIYLQSIVALFFPLEAFCFAVLLGRSNFLRVFHFHIKYMGWYFVKNLKGQTPLTGRNSIKILFKSLYNKDVHTLYQQFFSRNSFLIVLIKMPCAYVALYFVFFGHQGFSYEGMFLLSGFTIFLIVSTRYFLSIGEAERYLHYVYFFTLLIIMKSDDFFIIFCFSVLYGIFFQILDFLWFIFYRKKSKFDTSRIFKWLNENAKSGNILVVPDNYLDGWSLLTESQCNWAWPTYWSPKERAEFSQYFSDSGLIDFTKITDLLDRYHIDLVIIDRRKLSELHIDSNYEITAYNRIDHIENTVIYERANVS